MPVSRRNFITGRIELTDKDELFNGDPALEQRLDRVYAGELLVNVG